MNVMSNFVDWMEPDAGVEKMAHSNLLPGGLYVCNPTTSAGRHYVVGPFQSLVDVNEYLAQTTGFIDGEYITKVPSRAMGLRAVDGCAVALNLLLNGLTGIDADKGTAVEALASLLHEDAVPAEEAWEAIVNGRDFTIEGLI